MAATVYGGGSGRTRTEAIVYACPCGERFRAEVHRVVDSDNAAAWSALVDGRLNRVTCPVCNAVADVQVSVVVHDRATPQLALAIPEGQRHRELDERAALLTAVAADRQPTPDYLLYPVVVFGLGPVRALVNRREREETSPEVALPPARPVDLDEPTSERALPKIVDPRSAVVDRWIAGREGPLAFLVGDQVGVLASVPGPLCEALLAGPVELRIQLHRLPTYPILALAIVAAESDGARPRPDDQRAIFVTLDIARAAHRVVLDAIAKRSALRLEIYDNEYLHVADLDVQAALEDNVRRLVTDARDAYDRLAPSARGWERAKSALFHASYDRLGRTPVVLPDPTALDRPGAVLAALAVVGRWSEPSAEAYLAEIRSLPLSTFRAVRVRVVERAIALGLALSKTLYERVCRDTTLPPWPELLRRQMTAFGDVSARREPNDLSAAEEAENWERLLHECKTANVSVEGTAGRHAQSAERRARIAAGGGVDLRAMSSGELKALLEKKEMRREAAVLLCERGDAESLPALFSAVRKMPRAEANLVLPSMTTFGASAESWLLDGLKSGKSYIRQGCALSLGVLATPAAIDGLAQCVLQEPTEIWTEVARALGDVGAKAVPALSKRLREADPERRERLIHALAHVAARDEQGGGRAVAELARVRDPVVSGAAERALSLRQEVGRVDAAVRPEDEKGPPVEHTVVRGFSRRFYEALRAGSGAMELDVSDLEELGDDDEEDEEEIELTVGEVSVPAPVATISETGRRRKARGGAAVSGSIGHTGNTGRHGTPKPVSDEPTSPHPRSGLPEPGR